MRPKFRTALIAGLILAAGAVAIAVVSGLLYEQAHRAKDRELFPQVGRSVDIGGRMLDIYCSGAGGPAVILQSGAPWPILQDPRTMWQNGAPRPGYSWLGIQRELAKTTTACWYDRAGSGWSDTGPYPRDSASQARDLHALLRAAQVGPPYILVAESSAALDAHVFAGAYPEDVSGLVFVNGVHPDILIKRGPGGGRIERLPSFVGYSQDQMAQLCNLVGVYRLGLRNPPAPAPPPEGITSSEWNTIWRLARSPKARSALLQDIASWPASAAQARAAGTLGARPLIVLTGKNTSATSEYPSVWLELESDLARLSARGKLVTVNESREDLLYRAPAAIVDATRQVIGAIRQPGSPR